MTGLPSQRHLFDIPRDVAYFNCAYYSPQQNESRDRLVAGARAKSSPWERLAPSFFDDAETLRVLWSRLFGGDADGYAVVPAASYAISTAARAVEPRVKVVAVSTCHWTNGARIDLEPIGEACRSNGSVLVVDATQSLGAMPFSMDRVQPDFLTAPSYKWQLGPYGAGLLYVSEPSTSRSEACPCASHRTCTWTKTTSPGSFRPWTN